MSVADELARHLSARVSRTEGSARLIFEREGRWYNLGVRENPHVELSMAAPGLGKLAMWLQVGDSTVLPESAVTDACWRMRTNDELLTAMLLGELRWREPVIGTSGWDGAWTAPAPSSDESSGRLSKWYWLLGILVPPILVGMAIMNSGTNRTSGDPVYRYILEVKDEVATFQHYSHVANLPAALAMADHLLTLVMWHARLLQRAAALAEHLGGVLRGETMSNVVIALKRQGVELLIDLERTKARWRTRIRARSDREVVSYVEDLSLEPGHLSVMVERALEAAALEAAESGAPYR
jgi:hypothetical protein